MKKALLLPFLLLAGPTLWAQASNYPNGSTVANFTVTDLDGNTISLYDLTSQGKYVMLDFFFTTCGPCQATTPYFNQLHETYGCNAHDLYCLSVNNGYDNNAQVAAYETTYGGSYHHSPAVSNEGGGEAVTNTFGVNAFPTYCLISPANVMIDNDIWPVSSMATFVAAFPNGEVNTAPCAPAGITELPADRGFAIHPSPTSGPVTVEANGLGEGRLRMEVLDLLGQVVRTVDLGSTAGADLVRQVDLSGLVNGQYLCRVIAPKGVSKVQRIVVRH
jgi:cytochrome oxidase Cu insertion factor (SCO1/SenC/PrrC family)